jgi:hypothetical protein
MGALQVDLQRANPIQSGTASQVSLTVGPTGGSQQTVTWTYTSATGQLTRAVDGGRPVVELTGVVNATTGAPMFTYSDPGGASSASNVASCTTRVTVAILINPVRASHPYADTMDVELANRAPGSVPC